MKGGGRDATEVPASALSEELLRAVIEEFVSREGTDYGVVERSLEEKVADVRGQIDRGEVRILFDPKDESVNLVRSEERRTR